jgi:hypothetical protein
MHVREHEHDATMTLNFHERSKKICSCGPNSKAEPVPSVQLWTEWKAKPGSLRRYADGIVEALNKGEAQTWEVKYSIMSAHCGL